MQPRMNLSVIWVTRAFDIQSSLRSIMTRRWCPCSSAWGAIATDRASERRAWWVLRPPIAPASGGRGIRTHDDVAAIAVFKTAALGHYASPPTLGEPRGIPNDGPKRMPRAHPCCVGSEAETKEC